MASCQAVLLAEILALIDNRHLHTDATCCPDPAHYDVAIERPDRDVRVVIGVCASHELLVAAGASGYDRSIRKRPATT